MDSFLRYAELFVFNVVSASGIYLMAYFTSRHLETAYDYWYDLIAPALFVLGIVGWYKDADQLGDLVSWIVGIAIAVWGLKRFK